MEVVPLSPSVRRAARDALNTLADSYAGDDGPYEPALHWYVAVLYSAGDDEALRHVLVCTFL